MAKEPEKHSKLADVERLRLMRYNTKGPGAARARAPAKPSVEQLRSTLAKVGKKRLKNKRRRK